MSVRYAAPGTPERVDAITVFICRPAGHADGCSTTGCVGKAIAACLHELTGKAAGRRCGRKLCSKCDEDGLCPPHRRQQAKSRADHR